MTIFKNNLWTLFFLILLGGLVLLGTILFFRWQAIVSEEEHYHGARAELVGQSVDSILRTQELVLDVIGRELLNQDAVLSGSRKIPLLDRVLAANPVLVGFGLARPDGTLVRVSSNLDLASLPNLRTNPKTRDTFIRALSSGSMVLGRTYFVDALGSWVIPIRKAIRSETGDVVAVMTAGLRLGDGDTVFDETLHDSSHDRVILLREVDGYVQFVSGEGVGPEQYWKVQESMIRRQQNRDGFERHLGRSAEDVMANKDTAVVRTRRAGKDYLAAAIFNPRYQLWAVSETQFVPMYRAFFVSLAQYLLVFLAVILVFYKWFRVIDTAEGKRRQELYYLARHDDLTGLFNRNGLLDRLDALLSGKKTFLPGGDQY